MNILLKFYTFNEYIKSLIKIKNKGNFFESSIPVSIKIEGYPIFATPTFAVCMKFLNYEKLIPKIKQCQAKNDLDGASF